MRIKFHYYKTRYGVQRSDGALFLKGSRTLYIDSFNRLSSCMLECCPFYYLTCDKCSFCV